MYPARDRRGLQVGKSAAGHKSPPSAARCAPCPLADPHRTVQVESRCSRIGMQDTQTRLADIFLLPHGVPQLANPWFGNR